MSIKCGNCGERHNTVAEVRLCHNLVDIFISSGAPDRQVVVTCGWGKSSHKWETTVAEAVQHRNTCPEHRATKVQTIKVVDGPWQEDAMWVPDDSVQH